MSAFERLLEVLSEHDALLTVHGRGAECLCGARLTDSVEAYAVDAWREHQFQLLAATGLLVSPDHDAEVPASAPAAAPSPRGGSKYAPARSVRIDDDVWSRARARAKADGVTISEVINRFVEGYAEGRIDAPRLRMVYGSTS